EAEVGNACSGQRDFGRGLARWVADPVHRQLLAEFATGRQEPRRAGEVTHVKAIEARGVAGISTFAYLNDVFSVFRGQDRRETVLPDQGRIVAGGQLEPLGVEDRHEGVEERDAQSHALDL